MNKKTSIFARIMALTGVIILLISVIATMVVAIVKFEGSDRVFNALLVADVVIPGILWCYIMLYKMAKRKDEKLASEMDKAVKEMDQANK